MASTQTSLKTPFKDLTSFKGNMKRLYRERPEDAPIKKRPIAEQLNLKRRSLESSASLPRTPKVKREHADHAVAEQQPLHLPDSDMVDMEGRAAELHMLGSAKALDLSPGLKHTLAQFTLSSQSSLGGPAAFSARSGPESSSSPGAGSMGGGGALPTSPPSVLGAAPLLVPCDSSTELTHSLLEGESISCFAVGGEKRLCLPQVLNSVLRDFSLQQINAVCDDLYVYCSRCDAEQLHILKVLGILPFNAPSCGLITLTDAQRLCNALLRPGGAALPPSSSSSDKLPAPLGLLKESEASFQVEHQCLGKCQGLFVPQFYTQPEAPCIQCVECQLLFSPQKFVMHSHKSPDKRTCHWGFDSAKWPCYLLLGRKYLGQAEEPRLKRLLEEMKEKFHYPLKRSLDKKAVDEDHGRRSSPELCSPAGKLADTDPGRKGNAPPALLFNRLFSHIKEEPSPAGLLHPSFYLYTYDKMVAPNVSLPPEAELSPEVFAALLKQHYSRRALGPQEPAMDLHASLPSTPAPAEEAKSQPPPRLSAHLDHQETQRECQAQATPMDANQSSQKAATTTPPGPVSRAAPPPDLGGGERGGEERLDLRVGGERGGERGGGERLDLVGGEDDKNLIVVEIMQMYGQQQEKLNSTVQRQLQLEMELEAVRGGEAARLRELSAEQRELQGQLEAEQREQARRLALAQQEHTQLEARLDLLRTQSCSCGLQEAHYTSQLAELRGRLERAEAERLDLQDELRQEQEARGRLERLVTQLRQQMAQTGGAGPSGAEPGASPPPPPTPSSSTGAHSFSPPFSSSDAQVETK